MPKFTNRAEGSADYIGQTYADIGEVEVESNVISVEKTADMSLWIGYGPLTYTVTITNNDPDTVTGGDLENVMFEDVIDPSIAVLDTTTVTVDGAHQILNEDFIYNTSTGKFEFLRMADIAPMQTMEIKYSVVRS